MPGDMDIDTESKYEQANRSLERCINASIRAIFEEEDITYLKIVDDEMNNFFIHEPPESLSSKRKQYTDIYTALLDCLLNETSKDEYPYISTRVNQIVIMVSRKYKVNSTQLQMTLIRKHSAELNDYIRSKRPATITNRYMVNKEPCDSESTEDLHMTEIDEVVAGMNELCVQSIFG